mmetsp:Transcript_18157/g.61204  ORF Transcript_18157/g.61204 Transcript_18157/m.61204 type:complete len:379 (-) Transcript_18157:1755-2891(-)
MRHAVSLLKSAAPPNSKGVTALESVCACLTRSWNRGYAAAMARMRALWRASKRTLSKISGILLRSKTGPWPFLAFRRSSLRTSRHDSSQIRNVSPMYSGRSASTAWPSKALMRPSTSSKSFSSECRGFPNLCNAASTDSGPSGAMSLASRARSSSSPVESPKSKSTCMARSTCVLATLKSSCASWLPARSSMLTSDRPRWISETRMGEMSPSSSSRPFVKAAPVFITRPSSEVRILRSWRNVACSLRRPAPSSEAGYISRRKCAPSAVLCRTPSSVRTPPHFKTRTISVTISCSSHADGFNCNLQPLKSAIDMMIPCLVPSCTAGDGGAADFSGFFSGLSFFESLRVDSGSPSRFRASLRCSESLCSRSFVFAFSCAD